MAHQGSRGESELLAQPLKLSVYTSYGRADNGNICLHKVDADTELDDGDR